MVVNTASFFLIVPFLLQLRIDAADFPKCITQKSSCSCETDQGLIDLSALDSKDSSKPKFEKIPDATNPSNEDFYWNPCSSFSIAGTQCQNAAVCDRYISFYYVIGSQSSAVFINLPTGQLAIQYSYNSYKSTVTLDCDRKGESKVTAQPFSPNNYMLTLTGPYACPGGSGGNGGLSPGTILCILAICLVVIYLVVGVLYLRYARNATGIEMIPNLTFWLEIPGLVKDGTNFVINPIRRKAGYQEI